MSDIDELSRDFAQRHPDAFARVLGRGTIEENEQILLGLPAEQRAAIVARLPAQRVRQLLDSQRQAPADWLLDAPFDDAVTLLSRLPRDRRLELLNSLPDRERRRRLLRNQQYPSHSIGAIVGNIPLRVSAQTSAVEVLSEVRELDLDAQGPAVIVDSDGRYLGVLDRWRLLLRSPPAGQASDYLIPVKALRPEMPTGAVVANPDWSTRNWLPVIDSRRRPLGAVSREKVFHVAGADSASTQGGDVLLGLLADLVRFCDALLARAFVSKDAS